MSVNKINGRKNIPQVTKIVANNRLATVKEVNKVVIETNESNVLLQEQLAELPGEIQVDYTAAITAAITQALSQAIPFRTYVALLTQTGVQPPVATVLENTLGFNLVWAYIGVGQYRATGGSLPLNKTSITIGSNYNQTNFDSGVAQTTNTATSVDVWNYDDPASAGSINGFLLNTLIEIKVYN